MILSVKKMITIRFSEFTSDDNIQKSLEIINKFIKDKGYKTLGTSIFAFYNPPWTLPFLKRNKIIIELQE
jgi:hypothetical protein